MIVFFSKIDFKQIRAQLVSNIFENFENSRISAKSFVRLRFSEACCYADIVALTVLFCGNDWFFSKIAFKKTRARLISVDFADFEKCAVPDDAFKVIR